MNKIATRLELLRSKMKEVNIEAYVVSGNDNHGSEYVDDYYKTRKWISNFSGSAGSVVVTLDKALLWVDSRYYIQGAQQIKESEFILMKSDQGEDKEPAKWLMQNIGAAKRVGFDGNITPFSDYKVLNNTLKEKSISAVDVGDLFETIWQDRPTISQKGIEALDESIAGVSSQDKIKKIQAHLKKEEYDYTIISSLDDIAWTMNLRGFDIRFNRLFYAYLIIGCNEAFLFCEKEKFNKEVIERLPVTLVDYNSLISFIKKEIKGKKRLCYNPNKTTYRIKEAFDKEVHPVESIEFSTLLKAQKNETELKGMRKAHLLDGVAIVKLLSYLEETKEVLTELSVAQKLEEFRKESSDYIESSFTTIAGFKEHGALAHYSATSESSVSLKGDGLLVLDSGGQYKSGTTDITRTLLFGEATKQMKRDYTLVLKGNLALAKQLFPSGTCGYQLDILARQFMWQEGINYGHGTGHGVGFCLNVHEGPQNISPRAVTVALKEGMILSNEPGIYREGEYGIRVENLVVVQEVDKTEFGTFLGFEVLTIAPFERRLIDKSLLTENEIEMVDSYHSWVYSLLKEMLCPQDRSYLERATRSL